MLVGSMGGGASVELGEDAVESLDGGCDEKGLIGIPMAFARHRRHAGGCCRFRSSGSPRL